MAQFSIRRVLLDTDLTHASLQNAQMLGAQMRGAKLDGANLAGARITADISGGSLLHTILTGANLSAT
jgi:uncharacterized protein YjbI with pentapeptide repeats